MSTSQALASGGGSVYIYERHVYELYYCPPMQIQSEMSSYMYVRYCLPVTTPILSVCYGWLKSIVQNWNARKSAIYIYIRPFILQSLICLSSAAETRSGRVGWKDTQFTPLS